MKENFLTDETTAVFKPHIKAIANEYGCTPGYIYKILESEKNDPFQPFLEWYSACVRAGADVSPWDARLSAVRSKYRNLGQANVIECLSNKIFTDADTTAKVIQAAKDGRIDAGEREAICRLIQKEREALDSIETAMACPKVNYGGRVSTRTREEVKSKLNGRTR